MVLGLSSPSHNHDPVVGRKIANGSGLPRWATRSWPAGFRPWFPRPNQTRRELWDRKPDPILTNFALEPESVSMVILGSDRVLVAARSPEIETGGVVGAPGLVQHQPELPANFDS